MLGQIIGDNLGALVEFKSADEIREEYPSGVRDLTGGGPFDVMPGQPTDDSELALALARSMVRCGGFDETDVRDAYRRWAASNPFDIGGTCAAALIYPYERDATKPTNGALMRVSPLAVACEGDAERAGELARIDAALTHPNHYPVEVNAVYTAALADVIGGADAVTALRAHAGQLADEVETYFAEAPRDVLTKQGWVRHAFHITCYFAAHPTSFEEDLVAIVGLGGDTDTNAAIAGAFLGAIHGVDAIPPRWRTPVETYRPDATDRPEEYAPHDIVQLTDAFLGLAKGNGENV